LYAVLSPTRELAQQTHKVFQQFGKELGIESCCIVGGESMDKQKELIGKGVHVLVATPGRFTDLLKQKVVSLKNCMGIVFDEADRLFDMGFQKDIEFILRSASPQRQLIMVSATTSMDVLNTAYKFHSQPLEIKLNEDSLLVDHIDHKLAMVSREEKFPLLVNLLRKEEDVYAIVFCNTQVQTHMVAEWLKLMNFEASPISGKLAQNKRTKLLADFRAKKVRVLVCTDVAARGLDIKDVTLVINYELPQEAANYVHRIGRTGRAGKKGHAVSFVAYEDCDNLEPIYELIDSKIPKMDLQDEDFAKDICRKPYVDSKTLKVTDRRPNNDRKSNDRNSKNTKTRTDSKRPDTVRKERPAPKVIERKSPEERRKAYYFEAEGYGVDHAHAGAMKYFKIDDETLLGHEILEEGSRRFVIFGAKKTKVKYFVKPIYKKLLLPFLIKIIKQSGLNLFVKVHFKPTTLTVNFSGADEQLLANANFELLNAFEHIILTYLQTRVILHRNLKLKVKCFKKNESKPRVERPKTNEKSLFKLADIAKKNLLDSSESQLIKSLNAKDRRTIHMYLEDDKQIKSASVGDGAYKQIELSLK